ncbi:MAG: hypothetical protein OXF99_03515 [bacterium]|nr:hypothetical protein [bacterium]
MRFGAVLPFAGLSGSPLGTACQIIAASTIEDLGYSSNWAFGGMGRGFVLPNPLMAPTVTACGTTSVGLGTGIMQLPICNVAEVAHRLFSFEVSGPGSTRDDLQVFGDD